MKKFHHATLLGEIYDKQVSLQRIKREKRSLNLNVGDYF